MGARVTIAQVRLWGRTIGVVSLDPSTQIAAFQYTPEFANSGIQVSPIVMPLSSQVYTFPTLPKPSFKGLPGLLADSLPDKFGNALIDAWLATQGRTAESFNAVERLCYTGNRGMGALEFLPAAGPSVKTSETVDLDALVALASKVLQQREQITQSFAPSEREFTLQEILKVGTSAGGARAKAVIAWNRKTNEVRSGQVPADSDFEYWLIKFDGVNSNKDKELNDPQGFGAIEYAYYLMAQAAGIQISECRLLEENGRRHFMTKRFDRVQSSPSATSQKLHVQSLAAIAHFDFNNTRAYSYEQAFLVMRQLRLPMLQIEEQYRRMVFNVIARNQDDHVKNIAYTMNQQGLWSLAPAYDVAYSYNPFGDWTAQHQMSINGKRDNFNLDDLRACAATAMMKRGRHKIIISEVARAIMQWPSYAQTAQASINWTEQIKTNFRKLK
jgi:serine/threonine-protein kinase HipA